MAIRSTRDFHYNIVIPKHRHHHEASDWCTKKFGPRWSVVDNKEGTWCVFWKGRAVPGSYEWFFTNEKDFLLFSLRWAS